MVAAVGAGPSPIHHKSLTAENFAEALRFCHDDKVQEAAAGTARRMRNENGVRTAVMSFLNNLLVERMQCDYLTDHPASWTLRVHGKTTKISRVAAEILVREEEVNPGNFKALRTNPIIIENRRWDPVTGMTSGILGTATDVLGAVSDVYFKSAEEYKRGRCHTPSGKRFESGSNSRPKSRQATKPSTPGSRTMSHDIEPAAIVELNLTSQPENEHNQQSRLAIADNMALTGSKSVSKIIPTIYKGFPVDWPLAVTEGFRGMPRLWGEEVKDYGKVTDTKSGAVVAGKSLVLGIGDGIKDFTQMPGEGAKKEGAWGALKGVAKGTGSLLTKTVSGGLGLVAYPGQGVTKTLWTLTHGATGRRVAESRRAEGVWRAEGLDESIVRLVVEGYQDVSIGK